MRNFTANFLAQCDLKGSTPYLVMEIDWGSGYGTKYYMDRPPATLTAAGTRGPTIETPHVIQWPQIALSLKEGQVGAVESCSVTIDDTGHAISDILNNSVQQRSIVAIWRLFDDASTVWPTDAALMFSGTLLPFDWTIKDNKVTLNLGDASRLLQRDLSCTANQTTIPNSGAFPWLACPPESNDKNIPLGWGTAQRVEALLVQRPFRTITTQAIDGTTLTPTVTIQDDPTWFGIPLGTNVTVYVGNQVAVAQFFLNLEGTYSASLNFGGAPTVIATANVTYSKNGGGVSYPTFNDTTVFPQSLQSTLANVVMSGYPVAIELHNTSDPTNYPNGLYWAIVQNLIYNDPWNNYYHFTITSVLSGLQNQISAGDIIAFYQPIVSGNNSQPWPAGTPITIAPTSASPGQYGDPNFNQLANAPYTYAFNALAAKGVLKVEGFGNVQDAAGNTRKDFVLLGQSVQQVKSGTVVITNDSFSWFNVILNNNAWAATLGRNIATLNFPGSPRQTFTNLDDDRIWVTFQGVEDVGDSTGNLITNPALVILQYLENTHLMNINVGSINAASFAAAAAALAGYSIGFAQVEAQRGLELLQDIARQCHSVLFFDQGQANLVVLSNTPGGSVEFFSTQAADGVNDNILLGSVDIGDSSVDDVVNQVNFKWRAFWDDHTGNKPLDSKNANLVSVAAFTLQSKEIQVYIFYRLGDVATERDFWLERWSDIYRIVKFTTFHQALKLQAGDWITVTVEDPAGNVWFSDHLMQVMSTVDTCTGLVKVVARYVFAGYVNTNTTTTSTTSTTTTTTTGTGTTSSTTTTTTSSSTTTTTSSSTSSTTSTTTTNSCSGCGCKWNWNAGSSTWHQEYDCTRDGCSGSCTCGPPGFNGTTDGQVAFTGCHP